MGNIFKVGTNIPALQALFTLTNLNKDIQEVQSRLATGRKVNSAGDNPALFLAGRLIESSINEYVAKQTEIERGISFLEKNNARLDQVADILIEISSLINTANSGSVSSAEQQAISAEIALLTAEIDTILLSGVSSKIFSGFTIAKLSQVSVTGSAPTATSLSLNGTNLIVTGTAAQFTTSLNKVSSALRTILDAESTVGTFVKRLEFELSDNRVSETQERSQLSSIRDADLAEEQVKLTSLSILQQTTIVGLIQANNAPTAILGLIRS